MYLFFYVDDLILTNNDESSITSFTAHLNCEFAIKDLGDFNYFLGLEVNFTDHGHFIRQSKYANDVISHTNLLDSKLVPTPLATHETFTSD